MFGLFSKDRFCCVARYSDEGSANVGTGYGGGGGDYGGGVSYSGGGGGYSAPISAPVATTNAVQQSPVPVAVQTQAPRPAFDLSASSIAGAVAKGNEKSDVLSAYQTFLTGIPTGRGGQYAVSAQRQFGYSTIQDAAAAYLDAAGLRRLAETLSILDPEPVPDGSGVRTTKEAVGDGNPFLTFDELQDQFFELPDDPRFTNQGTQSAQSEQLTTLGELVKVFEKVFTAPASTDTPAPVVVVGDAAQQQRAGGGGAGLGVVIAVLALGAGIVYWFYLRKKGASSGN